MAENKRGKISQLPTLDALEGEESLLGVIGGQGYQIEVNTLKDFIGGTGGNGSVNFKNVPSDILPSITESYSLGNANKAWESTHTKAVVLGTTLIDEAQESVLVFGSDMAETVARVSSLLRSKSKSNPEESSFVMTELDMENYAKKDDIPSFDNYATKSFVEGEVKDIIGGASSSYNTLKKIEDKIEAIVDIPSGEVYLFGDGLTKKGSTVTVLPEYYETEIQAGTSLVTELHSTITIGPKGGLDINVDTDSGLGFTNTRALTVGKVKLAENANNSNTLNNKAESYFAKATDIDEYSSKFQGEIDGLWSRNSFEELILGHAAADTIAVGELNVDKVNGHEPIHGGNISGYLNGYALSGTSLASYGILDAYKDSEVDDLVNAVDKKAGNAATAASNAQNTANSALSKANANEASIAALGVNNTTLANKINEVDGIVKQNKTDIATLNGTTKDLQDSVSTLNVQMGSALSDIDKLINFYEGTDTDSIIDKWQELETVLEGLTESDNLAEILSGKADKSTVYTKTEVDTKLGSYATTSSVTELTAGVQMVQQDLLSKIGIKADKYYVDNNFVSNTRAASFVEFGSSLQIDEGVITINGESIEPLTSHQTLYSLTLQNSVGTTMFTYDPTTAPSGGYVYQLTKSMVGLGNVENTALSSWKGTANITTVGTITIGTWNGSKIGQSYLDLSGYAKSSELGSFAKKNSLAASDIPDLSGTYQTKITSTNKLSSSLVSGLGAASGYGVSQNDFTASDGNLVVGAAVYSHVTNRLKGYATQDWVNGKNYLTGITSAQVTGALGYTPYKSGDSPTFNTITLNGATLTLGTGVTLNDKNLAVAGSISEGGTLLSNKYQPIGNYVKPDDLSAAIGTALDAYGFASVAKTGNYNDLSNKPTSLPASDVSAWAKAASKPSYSWSEITSKPTFATVATSGKYSDLSNTPTLGSLASLNSVGEGQLDRNLLGMIQGKADASALANYLPLSGGVVKGIWPYNQYVLTLDTDNAYYTILSYMSKGERKGNVQYTADASVFAGMQMENLVSGDILGLSNTGVPMYNKNTLIHSGNIGSQTVASANKLSTYRSIWGKSFDGSGDVDGALSINGMEILYSNGVNTAYFGNKAVNSYVSGNNVYFRYGANESIGLILNSSGNVGIGTTDPKAKLHVNGIIYGNQYNASGNKAGAALILNKGSNWVGMGPSGGYVGRFSIGTVNSDGTWLNEVITFGDEGNVGIGTTEPTAKLHVEGSGKFTDSVDVGDSVTAGWLTLSTDLYVGGNVGIGTTSPVRKLHVNDNSGIPAILQSNQGTTALGFSQKDDGVAYLAYSGGTNWKITNRNWSAEYTLIHSGNFEEYTVHRQEYEGALTRLTQVENIAKSNSSSLEDLWADFEIERPKIANGYTAYGWGNHASAGYTKLKSKDGYTFLSVTGGVESEAGWALRIGTDFFLSSVQSAVYADYYSGSVYLGTPNYRWLSVYALSYDQSSDATLKDVVGDTSLTLSQIANAPAVSFTWKYNGKKDVGTLAQYWKDVLPEIVSGEEGNMGMNYAALGVVSSIILARNVETHEQRIERLEREITNLQSELDELRKNSE